MNSSIDRHPGRSPRLLSWLAAALFGGVLALASVAVTAQDATRGQLLFETGCNACHGRSVFSRTDRVARNPVQLREQVARWQKITGLPWTPAEIDDVSAYLDRAVYRFSPPPG
jgi:mono/diheme cytochrome c family protein